MARLNRCCRATTSPTSWSTAPARCSSKSPAGSSAPESVSATTSNLLNICQRIVSQVGRRVDESSPICDARLADGSRVNAIVPPLALDGPALTIRKFKKDKLTLDQLVKFGAISPEGAEILQIIGRCRCQRADLRRYRLRQDDAAELPDQLYRRRRAHHHLRRRRRTSTAAAACGAAGNPSAQYRGRGSDHHARTGPELPAYAARTHHRRRSPRTGSVRPAAGHEHRSRRIDGNAARQQSPRSAVALRIDDHDGRIFAALADHSRDDLRLDRRRSSRPPVCATARGASPTSPR